MHWSWNTGYKFLRVDGEVDTDGDGTVDTPISYHLGSNPFLKTMQINKEIQITKGQNTIYFSLDLNKLFDGITIKTELDTHTGNNIPLAELWKSNLDQAVTMKKYTRKRQANYGSVSVLASEFLWGYFFLD